MKMAQPELGKRIAELRKARGLTQEELVEKCNLSVRTLQRIEIDIRFRQNIIFLSIQNTRK
ncbi:MAG: helix-turn-helix domain-containing protein [Bacteroidota bacterium]